MSAGPIELPAEFIQRGERQMLKPQHLRAIAARQRFTSLYLQGYVTAGGTYMLASPARWNDNGQRRDLIALLPGRLMRDLGGGGPVVPVSMFVNPVLVEFIRDFLEEVWK